tara:strand:+ start:191 stop:586 length:396 start_codon:yes stop_codon:yes gene_type:complete
MINEIKVFHTDAIYKFRIININEKSYILKQCSIIKKNNLKNHIFIPKKNIFLNKNSVNQKLNIGDYLSAEIKNKNNISYIKKIIDITKIKKFNNEENKEKSNNIKNLSKKINFNKNNNKFSELYNSDSEID